MTDTTITEKADGTFEIECPECGDRSRSVVDKGAVRRAFEQHVRFDHDR